MQTIQRVFCILAITLVSLPLSGCESNMTEPAGETFMATGSSAQSGSQANVEGSSATGTDSSEQATIINKQAGSTSSQGSADSGTQTSGQTQTSTSDQAASAGGKTDPPSFDRPATDDSASRSSAGSETPGQAPSNAGPDDRAAGTGTSQGGSSTSANTGAWPVYANETYGFRILYPSAFTVQSPAADQGQSGPSPLLKVAFVEAKGELAGLTPPPFTVRVLDAGPATSLENWLNSHNLICLEANVEVSPFVGGYFEGLKVASRNFMAPGWDVFVLRGAHIFQLSPLGAEGETMLTTFEFVG